MTRTNHIPGWTIVPIEEVLTPLPNGNVLGQGWSPQCEKEPSPAENEWGVLRTTAIQAGSFLERENKRLPKTLEPRPHLEVKAGDLLITCAGPRSRCGVACLVRKTRRRLMISGKMYRFRTRPEIAASEFIEVYLQSREAWDAIDKMKTGGSDSGLNLTHERFKKLPIPLPPLPEQHRIVEKIEALFSELDKGVEQLKTAAQQLKVYRQSVLKWAFEGKLTAEWRRNVILSGTKWSEESEYRMVAESGASYGTKDESDSSSRQTATGLRMTSARELLDRIKQEREALAQTTGKRLKPIPPLTEKELAEPAKQTAGRLPALPVGWAWGTLEELAANEPNSITDGPFGSNLKTSHYTNEGPRVVRLQNIGDGQFIDEDAHISREHFEKLKKHRVHSGDIVIASLGSDPPRSCIVPESLGLAIVKADCIRFKAHPQLNAKWINFVINSEPTKKWGADIVHGVGRPRLNLRNIKNIRIPVPSRPEQDFIVQEIESRLSVCDKLEETIAASLQQAEALRQSILKKAFEGRLVEQDPNDPPASQLLEQIKRQKQEDNTGIAKRTKKATSAGR